VIVGLRLQTLTKNKRQNPNKFKVCAEAIFTHLGVALLLLRLAGICQNIVRYNARM
jgi:hypothetical protein